MGQQRTITLTNAPPVHIHEDTWREIATARWVESPSLRRANTTLVVREHEDGRRIIYGVYYPASGNLAEVRRAGVIINDRHTDTSYDTTIVTNTLATIEAVVKIISDRMPEAARKRLVQDCIASLPAELLS